MNENESSSNAAFFSNEMLVLRGSVSIQSRGCGGRAGYEYKVCVQPIPHNVFSL